MNSATSPSGAIAQMQVGDVGGHGAARVDQHDLHLRPLLLRRRDALVEHRMAPGEVGADQHDEIGKFQILVGARHRVGAEGAPVAGHRRGHAEARIGVDVGRADEALHQLVGDVVVLGQQLARDVEGDRVRAMLGDGLARTSPRRGRAPRPSSTRAPSIFGCKQPAVEAERLAERRALGAEPAEIGRMVGVAARRTLCRRRRLRQHAAADPAIGAGGPDLARSLRVSMCQAARLGQRVERDEAAHRPRP